jgi:hypothetical protein
MQFIKAALKDWHNNHAVDIHSLKRVCDLVQYSLYQSAGCNHVHCFLQQQAHRLAIPRQKIISDVMVRSFCFEMGVMGSCTLSKEVTHK